MRSGSLAATGGPPGSSCPPRQEAQGQDAGAAPHLPTQGGHGCATEGTA